MNVFSDIVGSPPRLRSGAPPARRGGGCPGRDRERDSGRIPRSDVAHRDAAVLNGSDRIHSHGAPPRRMTPNGCLGSPVMLWCQFDSVVKSQVWHETPHRNECLAVFSTQETDDTLVPPDCREDNPEIAVDSESGTNWFPLPRGRSIHTLSAYFGYPWPGLGDFIRNWYVERLRGIPFEWGSEIRLPDLFDTTGSP